MTSKTRRSSLIGQGAPLVGRDQLLTDTIGIVATNRLVTLTGVGGVGKTRLALRVGHELEDRYADGVQLIELAGVGDADAVPAAIATALGVTTQGDDDPLAAVAEALAGRRLLLVVDNCEHVARAAAQAITTVLDRCRTVSVLATSRESLWVAGEQRVAVSPLGLDGGAESDAAQLFVRRAQAVRPGFSVDDPATADAVVEICATVDGLPLAIELAAARMASMTATELRDRLEHRFRLLRGPAHRPERQQTLTDVVAWSYDLLDDAERQLLGVVSTFAGGFDLVSITEVVETVDEIELLARLDSLVHKSLVVADHNAGRTRYRVLETIRQFCDDQLAASGRRAELHDRHAAYFAGEAAHRWSSWNGPGWRVATDWVESEIANLRAAFRWSRTRGDLDVATDVAAHAALMGAPAQLFETVGWAEELLAAASAADVTRLPRLYTGAGYACFAGRPVEAAEHAHQATRLEADERYDPCEPGLAPFIEALASVYSGDLDRYVELSELVASLPGTARAYGLPAYVDGLQASGRVDEAVALTEESVEAARAVGNPFWIAYALWTAGLAHANVDAPRALAAWDEGVAVVEEHRVAFFEGFMARDAARLHATEGDARIALLRFAKAIGAFHNAGNVAQLIITVACVPALFERLGRFGEAATLHAAITREPASLHHVPELAELGDRVAAKLDAAARDANTAAGSGLDLNEAAVYARDQVERMAAELAAGAPEAGRPGGLTGREIEVLELIADGLTNREIAARLFIAAKTADSHVQHIYTKLGVTNRAAATRWAVDHGVVGASSEVP